MADRRIIVTDVFEAKLCSLCGSKELSQFYEVNTNFIEYYGVYFPLREIIAECLNFQISKETGESMEICLECKERVLSFYHFKRKVRDAQDLMHNRKSSTTNDTKPSHEHSRIVYSIYKIIKDFTDTCEVQSVSVDKTDKKLVIEAYNEDSQRCRKSRLDEEDEEDPTYFGNTIVKSEESFKESNFYNESFLEDQCGNSSASEENNTGSSSKHADIPYEPPKKKPKKKSTSSTKQENGNELGTLELSVSDVVNIFNPETNKWNDKYGDVFRKLMLSKYQTRVIVNFSFIGKKGIRVTLRCEKCRENYKVLGCRDDFVNRVPTTCLILSNRSDFCKCGFFARCKK